MLAARAYLPPPANPGYFIGQNRQARLLVGYANPKALEGANPGPRQHLTITRDSTGILTAAPPAGWQSIVLTGYQSDNHAQCAWELAFHWHKKAKPSVVFDEVLRDPHNFAPHPELYVPVWFLRDLCATSDATSGIDRKAIDALVNVVSGLEEVVDALFAGFTLALHDAGCNPPTHREQEKHVPLYLLFDVTFERRLQRIFATAVRSARGGRFLLAATVEALSWLRAACWTPQFAPLLFAYFDRFIAQVDDPLPTFDFGNVSPTEQHGNFVRALMALLGSTRWMEPAPQPLGLPFHHSSADIPPSVHWANAAILMDSRQIVGASLTDGGIGWLTDDMVGGGLPEWISSLEGVSANIVDTIPTDERQDVLQAQIAWLLFQASEGIYSPAGRWTIAIPEMLTPLTMCGFTHMRIIATERGMLVRLMHQTAWGMILNWTPDTSSGTRGWHSTMPPLIWYPIAVVLAALWRDLRVAGSTILHFRAATAPAEPAPAQTPTPPNKRDKGRTPRVLYAPRRPVVTITLGGTGETPPTNVHEWSGEDEQHEIVARRRHWVGAYPRRIQGKASPELRQFARDQGLGELPPEGLTMVRPHHRGRDTRETPARPVRAQGLLAAALLFRSPLLS